MKRLSHERNATSWWVVTPMTEVTPVLRETSLCDEICLSDLWSRIIFVQHIRTYLLLIYSKLFAILNRLYHTCTDIHIKECMCMCISFMSLDILKTELLPQLCVPSCFVLGHLPATSWHADALQRSDLRPEKCWLSQLRNLSGQWCQVTVQMSHLRRET